MEFIIIGLIFGFLALFGLKNFFDMKKAERQRQADDEVRDAKRKADFLACLGYPEK